MKTSIIRNLIRWGALGLALAIALAIYPTAATTRAAANDQPTAKGGYLYLNPPTTIVAGDGNQPFRLNAAVADGDPASTFTSEPVQSFVDQNDGTPVKGDSLPSSQSGNTPFETTSGMYVNPGYEGPITFYDSMKYNHPNQPQHTAYGATASWIGTHPVSGTVRIYIHTFLAETAESHLTGGRNYSVVLQADALGGSDVSVTNVGNNCGMTGFSFGGYSAQGFFSEQTVGFLPEVPVVTTCIYRGVAKFGQWEMPWAFPITVYPASPAFPILVTCPENGPQAGSVECSAVVTAKGDSTGYTIDYSLNDVKKGTIQNFNQVTKFTVGPLVKGNNIVRVAVHEPGGDVVNSQFDIVNGQSPWHLSLSISNGAHYVGDMVLYTAQVTNSSSLLPGVEFRAYVVLNHRYSEGQPFDISVEHTSNIGPVAPQNNELTLYVQSRGIGTDNDWQSLDSITFTFEGRPRPQPRIWVPIIIR